MNLDRCRSCGSGSLTPVMSLGRTPLANALLSEADLNRPEATFPLNLVFCTRCTLVQITEDVPPESMFSAYAYFSSFSDTMIRHARTLAERLIDEEGLRDGLTDGEILGDFELDGEREGETEGDVEGDFELDGERLGETEGETEGDRELDGLKDGLTDGERDGLRLLDGEIEGETDGETDGELLETCPKATFQ